MIRWAVLFLFFSTSGFTQSPNSFAQSKKIAAELFQAHSETIYCHCVYKEREVDLASCSMQGAEPKKRAHRIEWEHIMAAEHFGQHFECWRTPLCVTSTGISYKGRACCEHIDERFRHLESELYNLWPEVGLVNQARSNYRFGMLAQKKDFMGCRIKIDTKLHRAEPPDFAKGVVARAYLFMANHYDVPLSPAQKKLFEAWNKQFAPSQWEKGWASQVAAIEGYENPYISKWPSR